MPRLRRPSDSYVWQMTRKIWYAFLEDKASLWTRIARA
jgi:hypothetical protein